MTTQIPPVERNGYSVDEFLSRYGICRATFYKEVNSGELPSIKVCGRRIITRENEAVWLAKKAAS